MTTRRKNGVYYVKRSFSGIGQVYRSLGTKNAGRAHALEAMLISLHDQGRVELVQTFLDGDVTIEELASYYETNRIHELSAQLNNPDTSLSEACKDMLRLKAPDVGAKTLEGYRTGLGHFQRFAQSVAVATVSEALTKERIQEFKAFRLKDGVRHETINNDLIAISNLVTHALDQDWITKRPTIKRYKSTTRISYLEPTRLDMYFAALRAPFRPLFRLLVDTGMRLGEVQALRACDLRMGEETRALIEDAKTPEGVRPVFLPPETAAVLLAHIEEHGLLGTDQLFTMPRRSIQKEHGRACGLVGIHGYKLHDHRHTAAVRMARAGMPLNLIAQQLGHATITQVMRYARFHPEYGDVGPYFEKIRKSHEAALPGNKTGNTPSERVPEPEAPDGL